MTETSQMVHHTSVYRPDIDGLRAIAVLAVVIFHAFPKYLPGGFVGVDVFFVISGYLITGIIQEGLNTNSFSFLGFYARRIRRIFPALIASILLTVLLAWFLLVPVEMESLGGEVSAGSLFYSNFYYYGLTGYFDDSDDLKYLKHLWSLAVEEHFYFIWPALVVALHKVKSHRWIYVSGMLLVSFGLCVWLTQRNENLAFFFSVTRFWELFAGAVLAQTQLISAGPSLQKYNTQALRNGAAVLGLLGILASVGVLDSGEGFPGWKAALPVFATALTIWAGMGAWSNRVILGSKAPVYIGLLSYPIYLFHWPLLMFAQTVSVQTPSTFTRFAAIAVSILLAALLFHSVEKPLRKHVKAQRAAAVLLPFAALGWLLGYVLVAGEGFPQRAAARFGPEVTAYQQSQQLAENTQVACGAAPSDRFGCHAQGSLNKAEVVLIGDSHAGALYPGLRKAFAARGVQVAWLGGNACPFLLGLERDASCGNDAAEILDIVATLPNVSTVVLASRWPLYATNDYFGPVEVKMKRHPVSLVDQPELQDPAKILEASLLRTVEAIGKLGKRVVLVGSVPEIGVHPARCFRRPFKPEPQNCEVTVEEMRKRTEISRSVLEAVANRFEYVDLFDAAPLLCAAQTCSALSNGAFLYSDDDHLSLLGSERVGAGLVENMLK